MSQNLCKQPAGALSIILLLLFHNLLLLRLLPVVNLKVKLLDANRRVKLPIRLAIWLSGCLNWSSEFEGCTLYCSLRWSLH